MQIDEDRGKCEKLAAENNRLSKEVAQLKISNVKMQDDVKNIETEFAEKLRAQQQVRRGCLWLLRVALLTGSLTGGGAGEEDGD